MLWLGDAPSSTKDKSAEQVIKGLDASFENLKHRFSHATPVNEVG